MEILGFLLITLAVWCGYCGFESYNPFSLLLAIVTDPGKTSSLMVSAKSQASSAVASSPVPSVGTETPNTSTSLFAGSLPASGKSQSDIGAYQTYARDVLASKYNITDSADNAALVSLWNRESGWNPSAMNPTSKAYGIPQALPLSKLPNGQASTAQQQIDWGLSYIINRYGSPSKAWAHETQFGWY